MPKDTHLENPLAIIGEEDAVLGFKALGFKVYPIRNFAQTSKPDVSNEVDIAKEVQEFRVALEEAVGQKTAIFLVQDEIYRLAQDAINVYRNLALPIFIPFSKGAKSNLLDEIVKAIRLKATGTF